METNEQELYDMVAFEFKSYYVVWKQDWTAAMKYVELSLNRTM